MPSSASMTQPKIVNGKVPSTMRKASKETEAPPTIAVAHPARLRRSAISRMIPPTSRGGRERTATRWSFGRTEMSLLTSRYAAPGSRPNMIASSRTPVGTTAKAVKNANNQCRVCKSLCPPLGVLYGDHELKPQRRQSSARQSLASAVPRPQAPTGPACRSCPCRGRGLDHCQWRGFV